MPLIAQEKFTAEDQIFFNQKLPEYTKWLEYHNLSDVVKVHQLKFTEDSLILYLDLAYEDIDTAKQAWEQAKETFDTNRVSTLEEELFYYFVHLFEIEPTQLSIEIFSTYESKPYAYIGLYYENRKFKVITDFNKAANRDVKIQPLYLKNIEAKKFSLKRQGTRSSQAERLALFDKIYTYTKAYYQDMGALTKIYEGDQLGDIKLRFRVWNLRNEMLKNANSTLDNIFGGKREMMYFVISYDSASQILEIEIHGKFGSSIWKPRLSAYLEMEPEYKFQLEEYADKFKRDIQKELARN